MIELIILGIFIMVLMSLEVSASVNNKILSSQGENINDGIVAINEANTNYNTTKNHFLIIESRSFKSSFICFFSKIKINIK